MPNDEMMSFEETMKTIKRYLAREICVRDVDNLEPLLDQLQIEYDLLKIAKLLKR
jgi:hypothetical protein